MEGEGDGANASSSHTEHCDMNKLDAALMSKFMWSYGSMLLLLSGFIERLEYFGESCPCHARALGEHALSYKDIGVDFTRQLSK